MTFANSLKQSLEGLRTWATPKSRILLRQVSDEETLARYVYSKSDFGSGRVKMRAFMPVNGEVSVFRTIGLTEKGIWQLAGTAARRDKSPRAFGALQAACVTKTGLKIDPDNTPQRHANIVSWPPQKEDQKELAQDLANASALILRN